MRELKPKRGEVWIAQLDPVRGREQAKKRPCIILSVDTINQGSGKLVIAVPLTSKMRNKHGYFSITPPEGGVLENSYVLCEQIRVLSHERLLGKSIGNVSTETLLKMEYWLNFLLGFGTGEN